LPNPSDLPKCPFYGGSLGGRRVVVHLLKTEFRDSSLGFRTALGLQKIREPVPPIFPDVFDCLRRDYNVLRI
jgi:hypothetical protein